MKRRLDVESTMALTHWGWSTCGEAPSGGALSQTLRHGTPRHLCSALLWRLLRGKDPAWLRWDLNPPGAYEEALAFFQSQLTERDQP